MRNMCSLLGVPVRMTKHIFVVAVVSIFCSQSLAQNGSQVEYPPLTGMIAQNWVPLIPVIICGRAVSHLNPVGEVRKSRFTGRPIMPFVITVKVENVVQGDVSAGDSISIYTFVDVDSEGGTGRLQYVEIGDRNIYLLLRDGDTFRLVCDGCAYGAPKVYSGAHPGLKRNENLLAAEQIAEILLTRGECATDEGMVEGIHRSGFPWLDWKIVFAR